MRFYSLRKYLFIGLVLAVGSCVPTSYEEITEFRDRAEITAFSVPDSASATNIPLHISAILGKTTASRFETIYYERKDSLFQFVVFAKRTERTGVQYETKDIVLDTTLVLSTNPPRTGLHYFRIYSGATDSLQVSSRLY